MTNSDEAYIKAKAAEFHRLRQIYQVLPRLKKTKAAPQQK